MPRNYKSEYDNYHSKPKAKKQRARNNKARRKALKRGTVKKGDGYDIAHTKPGARGKTFKQKASANRSFRRTKQAKRKK